MVDFKRGNNGCNGGDPRAAIQYIVENGLEAYKDYPYLPFDGKCRYKADKATAHFSDWIEVREEDEEDLTAVLKYHKYCTFMTMVGNTAQSVLPLMHIQVCKNKSCGMLTVISVLPVL